MIERPLAGKTALVTGASSGIGAAVAEALAAAGARLLLTGRDAGRLAAVAGRCGQAETLPADLADLANDGEDGEGGDVHRLAARTGELFDRLDILIHAAGALFFGPVAATPLADLDRVLTINLRAPYLLTQLTLPLLRAARGQVVFVSSGVIRRTAPELSAYTASKMGLLGLADCLREEVAADGIRVITAAPGRTATPMQAELRRFEGQAYDPAGLLQPHDVASLVVAVLTLPRTAAVTDLFLRPGP
jgi:NAD(P)-dependent dehydrogenase (short-subunit alcohol dehydrogenase family)